VARDGLPQLVQSDPESLRRGVQGLRMRLLWIHTLRLNPYLKDSVAARRNPSRTKLIVRFCQIQAERIEAIAQISWCIEAFTSKNMAQVRLTIRATHLDTRHAHGLIFDISNLVIICRCVEGWPTAASIEFRV